MRRIVWEELWFEAYRQLVAEDRTAAREVRERVNALARDAEPADSVRWGTTSYYRLRIGAWRVLYEIDDDTVRVWSLGRIVGEQPQA